MLPKLPRTVHDWQLFSDMPGVKAVAAALTSALREARKVQKNGEDPWKILYPVMEKYSKFGACDTEPREVAASHLAACEIVYRIYVVTRLSPDNKSKAIHWFH